MRRLLVLAIFLMAGAAMAQQHRISVQKFAAPVYPPIARSAHVAGDVKLALEVNPDGTITSTKVLSGHPILTQASLEAIKQWKFHCDDCLYGEGFRHQVTFSFQPDESDTSKSVIYEFPDKVTVYAARGVIEGIVAMNRPRYFWLWKLFHPKSWRFHDYDHDWQDTSHG